MTARSALSEAGAAADALRRTTSLEGVGGF
jgi:hypothetical protein